MDITIIEKTTKTIQEKLTKDNGRGKEVEVMVPKTVTEEVPVEFETNPHEIVISAISRYTRRFNKRLPPGCVAWAVKSKATGVYLPLLCTFQELGKAAVEKGIYVEAE